MVIEVPEPAPDHFNRVVQFNGRTVIIIHVAGGKWVALEGICTHMGCPLHYNPDTGEIVCVCHQGRFDLAGNVISGPPPRPLRTYSLEVEKNSVTIYN